MGTNNGNVDVQKKTLIVNELLTYAFKHVNSRTKDSIVKTICDFYEPEEIITASATLCSVYENNEDVLLQFKAPRKCTANDNAAVKKIVEDLICKGVLIIASHPGIEIPFCAVDLDRLPKFAPDEDNLHSVLLCLAKVEAQVKRHDLDITEVKNTQPMTAIRSPATAEPAGMMTTDRPQIASSGNDISYMLQ